MEIHDATSDFLDNLKAEYLEIIKEQQKAEIPLNTSPRVDKSSADFQLLNDMRNRKYAEKVNFWLLANSKDFSAYFSNAHFIASSYTSSPSGTVQENNFMNMILEKLNFLATNMNIDHNNSYEDIFNKIQAILNS